MKADETGDSSAWSREQDKAFENALATYPEDSADWWEKIAADVPGKSLEEIKHHYELLVDDINNIESGCVPLPCYNSSSDGSTSHAGDEGTGKKGGHFGNFNGDSNHGGKASRSDQERRKGIAWTEEEHRFSIIGKGNSCDILCNLSNILAARLGATPMPAFQFCLQFWMASSLLSDGLAIAGQVTYPTSHQHATWSLDDLPRIVACTMHQGSAVTSMDFHPSHHTLLLAMMVFDQ